MAVFETYAVRIGLGLGLVLAALGAGPGAESASKSGPVRLREEAGRGATTRAEVVLKGEGRYIPAPPPGGAGSSSREKDAPKPLALKVESRLEFAERVLAADDKSRPTRAARRVFRAASAVNGDVRPSTVTLRPAVALLVAEVRDPGVVVFSPLGPLTRSELEVVQGPGDPLALGGLLPDRPVEPGDRWKVGDEAVKGLTAYDTLTSGGLEATLESADAATARVRVRGEVRGSVLGGEGTMACDGSYTFDRAAGRLARLTLERAETRRPGPVEGGLDVKSTLSVTRTAAEPPRELTDAVLNRVDLGPSPEHERLLFASPGGKYTLRHDRDWHIYWDDPRLTVLKRVEGGQAVAQCNLAAGPNAGKGRHQDPVQFRDDIRKGLGSRFVDFLGEGEVDGDPAGGYRYKVGAQGHQGDVGVVWYYYLLAAPDGDQLLATFTLASSRSRSFGDRDEALIGSLRWTAPGPGGR